MNIGEFAAALHYAVDGNDTAEHAAVDLLISRGRWVNLLHEEVDVYSTWDESSPGRPQVHVDWTALGDRLRFHEIVAMPADLTVLQAACSLAAGCPTDLQAIAADADEEGLRRILTAVAQAAAHPELGPAV